jgi:hypothetical protein
MPGLYCNDARKPLKASGKRGRKRRSALSRVMAGFMPAIHAIAELHC